MRAFVMVLTLFFCVGCEDFGNALKSERKPVAPSGIATDSDVTEVQKAAEGIQGTASKSTQRAPTYRTKVSESTTDATSPKRSIGKMTAKIVDAKETLTNPKVVIVENQVSGNDPLTIAANAYVSSTSRASAANFKRQLDLIKATNGNYPTYEEYMQLAKQLHIDFALLPPYQMYGYDSDTGGLVVLEDKAEKIQRYDELGIPLDEGDKKYK